MKIRGWLAIMVLAFAMVGTGCSRTDPSVVARAETATEVAEGEGGIEVAAVEAGIAYQQTELTAPADAAFAVQFINPAVLPHNWVLVQPGQEEAVASAADQEGNVPPDTEGVIAASPIITSNSAQVPVDALAAGEYTYICTYPGHYAAGMAGTLIVGP
jgi:uncharacterized cupredoxin-like copper-binding protein